MQISQCKQKQLKNFIRLIFFKKLKGFGKIKTKINQNWFDNIAWFFNLLIFKVTQLFTLLN